MRVTSAIDYVAFMSLSDLKTDELLNNDLTELK
jgi:hypothetical protein